MADENTQGADQNEAPETQPEQAEEKLFTQEEVNKFVEGRLARIRSGAEKAAKAAYETKLAELEQREMQLLVREELQKRGLDKGLAAILSPSSAEDLTAKLDILQSYLKPATAGKAQSQKGGFSIGTPSESGQGVHKADPYRKAMGLK